MGERRRNAVETNLRCVLGSQRSHERFVCSFGHGNGGVKGHAGLNGYAAEQHYRCLRALFELVDVGLNKRYRPQCVHFPVVLKLSRWESVKGLQVDGPREVYKSIDRPRYFRIRCARVGGNGMQRGISFCRSSANANYGVAFFY